MRTTTSPTYPLGAWLFAAASVFSLAGCDEGLEQSAGGCRSTTECPFFQVCKLPEETCLPEPTDAVLGRFGCAVGASGPAAVGSSEVTGTLAGSRYALVTGASCRLTPNGTYFVVTANGLTPDHQAANTLAIVVRPSAVVPGAAYPLFWNDTNTIDKVDSGALWTGNTTSNVQILGLATGGYMVFDQFPAEGAAVSGYLELGLRLP